jgi:hypothetical protein
MPVYHTGTSVLFLKFIPALTNTYYIHLTFPVCFLTVYPCSVSKKYTGISTFPFQALILCHCQYERDTELLRWENTSATQSGTLIFCVGYAYKSTQICCDNFRRNGKIFCFGE